MRALICLLMISAVLVNAASACDICGGTQGPPLSAELLSARLVVFGPIVSSKLSADGTSGVSELRIDAVVKADPKFKNLKTITLPRYAPPDSKVKHLVFLDVQKDQLDPYRVITYPASSRIVKYLTEAPPWLEPKVSPDVRSQRLPYYLSYLNDPEPEIAFDAFKEWASASNREVGLIASKLPPDNLRKWLVDPKAPARCIGLYAYLLGACGGEKDADVIRALILGLDDRTSNALDGLLAGYIQLRGEEAWQLTHTIINDSRRPFTQRHAILRMLRFYQGFDPEKYRKPILDCSALLLKQSDIHDLAVDHLRKWKLWDLTDQVLGLYTNKEQLAPITRRTIARYALSCPLPQAKRFADDLRRKEPALVEDVQESLQLEKLGPP